MLVYDMRNEYRNLTTILNGLRDRYHHFQMTGTPGVIRTPSKSAITTEMINCHYQRTYGFGLTICLIFNCILKAIDTNSTDLDVDAKHFCKESLKHADEAAKYRPLCASYVQLSLTAAWCCSEDEAERVALEKVFFDYSSDFGWSSEDAIRAVLQETYRSLRLLDP